MEWRGERREGDRELWKMARERADDGAGKDGEGGGQGRREEGNAAARLLTVASLAAILDGVGPSEKSRGDSV